MTQEQLQQPPMDRKDLKIQALINKVTRTENENADYQVELHLVGEQLRSVQQELEELRQQVGPQRPPTDLPSLETLPSEVSDVEAEEVSVPSE